MASKSINATLFQRAIRDERWADAADMVRDRLATSRDTSNEGGGDDLIDWLQMGHWGDVNTATPARVAAEWDRMVRENS